MIAAATLAELTLPTADGEPTHIGQWRGKTLVINYWATWCPPCREEMPLFSRLQTENATNGVQFVGIAVDNAANVLDFSRHTPSSYPLLIASPESLKLAKTLGNTAGSLPFTIVIGADGTLRDTRIGGLDEQEIRKMLRQ